MKKLALITILLLLGLNTYHLSSQEKKDVQDNESVEWKINGIRDGWYITFASGIQTIFADDDSKQSNLLKRFTYAPAITVGKYFSPSWGLRLTISGGSLHGYNDGADGLYRKWQIDKYLDGKGHAGKPGYPANTGIDFQSWDPQWSRLGFSLDNGEIFVNKDGRYEWRGASEGRYYMQHIRYVTTSLDFMFDLLALFGNYNPEKPFEITPFAGITYAHVFPHYGNEAHNVMGIGGGLNFRFRLNDKFNLNIEPRVIMFPDSFDGHVGNREDDGVGQLLAGITYKIGKGAQPVQPKVDNDLVNQLNNTINDLKYKLDNIPPCPVLPEPVPEVVEKEVFNPDPVFFRIDKSVIDNTEWYKIERVVAYMKANPDISVVIVGYADVQTAYPAYNLKLSERRVNAVREALITKYNIPESRISIDWKGDRIQPFKENELNRVVIFVIEN